MHPLVIVPGFMASSLQTLSKIPVWEPTLFSLGHLSIENELESKGLISDYYSGLLNYLKSIGYKKDETLFEFPYDWRQKVETNGEKLYDYIQKMQNKHGFDSVDIINHSMGGLVTRQAHKLGANISKTIYIASPHYGMHSAYRMIHPYLAEEYITEWLIKFLGSAFKAFVAGILAAGTLHLTKKLSHIIAQFPSCYDLLPDKFYFQNQSLVNDIQNMEETYFGENNNEGPWNFQDFQLDEVKRSMKFKEELGKDLPGNENLIIYSTNVKTYDRIKWEKNSTSKNIILEESKTKNGETIGGDETIGAKSLLLEGGNPNGSRSLVAGIHHEVQNKIEAHKAIYKFLKPTSE